jgi:KaiC/GvpD/RAD55 family RecA-like ATPase
LKTWIKSLDETLGGGLPEKSVVLIVGEPGSGYDVFAQQILYENAIRKGKVAYFSTVRTAEALCEDLETFGWNLIPLQENSSWQFLDAHVPDLTQFLIEKIPIAMGEGRWVLIDSLSHLILTQKYRSVIKIIELFLESAEKYGGIHFLLLTQKMHSIETEITIQHFVDGVIEFLAQESISGIDRRIRIKKMRRAIYEPRLIPFNITDHGITIENAVRIT